MGKLNDTHIRFDESSQEWQHVDNESHKVLHVADTCVELEVKMKEEG